MSGDAMRVGQRNSKKSQQPITSLHIAKACLPLPPSYRSTANQCKLSEQEGAKKGTEGFGEMGVAMEAVPIESADTEEQHST